MYRIVWFKSSGKPTAAYRTLSGKAEGKNTYLVWEAYHISNPDELKVWRRRGLKEINTPGNPAIPRGSIAFYGGPYNNAK